MSDQTLTERFQHARRRMMMIGGGAGVCWALAAAIALLLVAVWLDLVWDLPPAARVAAMVVAGGAAILLLVVAVVRIVRAATAAQVARRLDRAGGTGGLILSGWELLTGTPSDNPLRQGMSQIAIGQAAERSQHVSLAAAVPARPVRRSLVVLAASIAVVAALALAMPSLARTEWRRFTNLDGDVPPYSPTEFRVTPGDAQVIYGAGLDVRVETVGPAVESIELVIVDGAREDSLPMFAEAAGSWRAAVARVTEPSQYFVRAGRSRSPRFRIDVVTVPKIESVEFRIAPPEYTRDAVYRGELPADGVAGLAGTRVEVAATSNRPLSGGRIQLSGAGLDETVAMQPAGEGDNTVNGYFTIRASGKFELTVEDVAGQQSQEKFGGSITLLEDQRPFVRLTEPRSRSLATPTAHLPVTAAAEDDYGITRLQLFRSLNDSRPLPTDLAVDPPPPRRLHERVYLPLADYGLAAGDVIKLFARVEDNNPAGARGAESSVVTVQIVSQEDFERMIRTRQGLQVLMSKYQQARRRMERLAEETRGLKKKLKDQKPGDPLDEELRSKLRELAARMNKEAQAIEESAKHLLPYDLDKNLTEQLLRLARETDAMSAKASDLADNTNLTRAQLADELEKLAQQLGQQRDEFNQQAMLPMELLAKVYPLIEDQSRFVALAQHQRDLAERLAAAKDRDGEDDPLAKGRLRDLQEEQHSIREALEQLLRDIEDHAQQLPTDSLEEGGEEIDKLRASALLFVDELQSSGADEAMAAAETALAELSGKRGHEQAERAANILDSFLKKCEGMGQQGSACLAFQPSLSRCLGDTVSQLLAEAGLGSGMGGGAGGGYSARRSTLSNTGLYGALPGAGESGRENDGRTGDASDGAGGFAASGSNPDQPDATDAATENRAGGTIGPLVPPRYQRRVGKYFQRVAEAED